MKTRDTIGLSALAAIILGTLGFFHIITDHFCLIPKEHFTFSMTFISVEDVVDRYNNRDVGQRIRGNILFDHLVSELQADSLITPLKPEPILDDKEGL